VPVETGAVQLGSRGNAGHHHIAAIAGVAGHDKAPGLSGLPLGGLPGSASGSRSQRCLIAAKPAAAHSQRKTPECQVPPHSFQRRFLQDLLQDGNVPMSPAGQEYANVQRQKGWGPRPSNSAVRGADDATVTARLHRAARRILPFLSLGFNRKRRQPAEPVRVAGRHQRRLF
jgi:hypothetical protein